jgi:hypothetical protein
VNTKYYNTGVVILPSPKQDEPKTKIGGCLPVGWAKRSVPNIDVEKLLVELLAIPLGNQKTVAKSLVMAMHPNDTLVGWARFALPNLRTTAPMPLYRRH